MANRTRNIILAAIAAALCLVGWVWHVRSDANARYRLYALEGRAGFEAYCARDYALAEKHFLRERLLLRAENDSVFSLLDKSKYAQMLLYCNVFLYLSARNANDTKAMDTYRADAQAEYVNCLRQAENDGINCKNSDGAIYSLDEVIASLETVVRRTSKLSGKNSP